MERLRIEDVDGAGADCVHRQTPNSAGPVQTARASSRYGLRWLIEILAKKRRRDAAGGLAAEDGPAPELESHI